MGRTHKLRTDITKLFAMGRLKSNLYYLTPFTHLKHFTCSHESHYNSIYVPLIVISFGFLIVILVIVWDFYFGWNILFYFFFLVAIRYLWKPWEIFQLLSEQWSKNLDFFSPIGGKNLALNLNYVLKSTKLVITNGRLLWRMGV